MWVGLAINMELNNLMYICWFMILVYLQELERQQRERNCVYLAKIFKSMKNITYRTTWAEVATYSYCLMMLLYFFNRFRSC